MRCVTGFLAALAMTCTPLFAQSDAFGTLNPDEMTWQNMLDRADRGETGMVLCSSGYMMTKSGDHAAARRIFEACAKAGYTGTMTWMSYMENNGFGGDFNPDASAEWDQRAAEAGDPVGQFNHGINLLRDHGIGQDDTAGRAMISAAAEAGLEIAQTLIDADYDLDVVTPDADNWRYAPSF